MRLDQVVEVVHNQQGAGAAKRSRTALLKLLSDNSLHRNGQSSEPDAFVALGGFVGYCVATNADAANPRSLATLPAVLDVMAWLLDVVFCLNAQGRYAAAAQLLTRTQSCLGRVRKRLRRIANANEQLGRACGDLATRLDHLRIIWGLGHVVNLFGGADVWFAMHRNARYGVSQFQSRMKTVHGTIRRMERRVGAGKYALDDDYFLYRGRLHLLRGRSACFLGDFTTAHRELDLGAAALQSASTGTELYVAIGQLVGAELLLLESDAAVDTEGSLDESIACRQRDKLERAEAHLSVAEGIMIQHRRNMYWWNKLTILKAEWAAQRLLWVTTGSPTSLRGTDSTLRLLADIEDVARAGLSAVMAGFDSCFHPWRLGNLPAATKDASMVVYRRLIEVWVQMCAFYYLAGVTVSGHVRAAVLAGRSSDDNGRLGPGVFEKLSRDKAHVEFAETESALRRWEWLNRMTGFEPLIGPEAMDPLRRLLGDVRSCFGCSQDPGTSDRAADAVALAYRGL